MTYWAYKITLPNTELPRELFFNTREAAEQFGRDFVASSRESVVFLSGVHTDDTGTIEETRINDIQ